MAEVDIATLGIKVDATTADEASNKLENLAKSGELAENSTKGVSSATRQMQAAIMAAIGAINANTTALGSFNNELNKNTGATRGAANAADDMESRVNKLRSVVDPMASAIDRVNAELAEARVLFEAGAISAGDYARAQTVLNARIADFERRQGLMNASMGIGARSAKLQAHEMLNLSRQFADIGVTAAMGMNPLMILVQQGPQIADVLGTARARGISASQAFLQMGQSVMPFMRVIGPLGVAAGLTFGVLGLAAHHASESLGDVQKELGLTEKQMDRLKEKGTDLGFTMSDVMGGIAASIAQSIGFDDIEQAWDNLLDYLGGGANDFIEDILGWFGGMTNSIKVFFSDVPRSVGAVLIATLNIVITTINDMVERGTRVINNFLNMLPDWVGVKGDLKAPSIANVQNPLQDQMDKMTGAFDEGRDNAVNAFRNGRAAHRRNRILEDAGDPGKERAGRKPRKSEEERDWESALKAAENYTKSLKENTEEIGKNQFELKALATQRAQNAILEAAQKAELSGINGAMDKAHNLMARMSIAQAEWNEAMNNEKIRQMKLALTDEAEAMRFEQGLISLNNEEREKAIKRREIELEIIQAQRQGHYDLAIAIAQEANAVIDLAGAQGKRKDMAEEAARTATTMRDMADSVRDATESFGDLFGTVGEGYANVMNTIFDFQATQAEAQERLIELQSKYAEGQAMSAEDQFEAARLQSEMMQNQVALYGNLLGAAKTFFKEGSTGWKIMEAAERAYRLFQFAMAIKSMILDKTQTASSVANSGARAAADGVAAVAKAIASLPFPLNIAAGAATLAFLVAIGVKMFGKGGGGKAASSAGSSSKSATDAYNGPRDEYGAPTSYYSVLRPGYTNVAGTWSRPGAGGGAGMGGVSIGDTTLIVQGSLDSATIPQVKQMLDEHKTNTIEDARAAIARDAAERNNRYSIGG